MNAALNAIDAHLRDMRGEATLSAFQRTRDECSDMKE